MSVASKVIGVSTEDVRKKGLRRVSRSLWNPEEPKIMAKDETTGRHVNFYQVYKKHPVIFYGMIAGVILYAVMRVRSMLR